MVCLCGCGADNQHCHLPNRPPSPNTFYENFWAPTFVELLESSLRRVLATNEPSKRVQWRRIFGGDAQDESPPRSEKRHPTRVSDGNRDGRLYSPALSIPDSERINTLSEQSYDSSNLTMELSTPTYQRYSGLYSPPLDSCRAEQTREDLSQVSVRKAQSSSLRSARDRLRRQAGLDEPTFLNLQSPPLESQKESFSWESPPKLFDSQPLSIPPISMYESARENTQPSNSQEPDFTQLQSQNHYDVPIRPEQYLASLTPLPENQKTYPNEHYQTKFLRSPPPANQAPTRQERREEKMLGSVMRKIEGKECQLNSGNAVLLVPYVFNQPVPDLTARPPTHTLPFQFGQGYTHPFYGQYDHSNKTSPMRRPCLPYSNSRALRKSKRDKEEIGKPARHIRSSTGSRHGGAKKLIKMPWWK